MRRRVDIRTIYDRIKVRYPDAYIAIQSGDFVSFILSQARELALPMGETLNRDLGYDSLSVHRLRFDDLARRIQLQTHDNQRGMTPSPSRARIRTAHQVSIVVLVCPQ